MTRKWRLVGGPLASLTTRVGGTVDNLPARSETPSAFHNGQPDAPSVAHSVAHLGVDQATPHPFPNGVEGDANALPDSQPGSILESRYRLDAVLDSGGMGIVYDAHDLRLGRAVALKICRSGSHRWLNEGKIAAKLEPPGIVAIYDEFRQPDGRQCYVMQKLPKGNFDQYLSSADTRPGGTRFRDALHFFIRICEIIQRTHSQGVVHRDLKPANVICGDAGVYVLDWGLAWEITNTAPPPIGAEGTLEYMSPQQATGGQNAIAPSNDTFSLGASLYQILTGRPPYLCGQLTDSPDVTRTDRATAATTGPSPESPAQAPRADRAGLVSEVKAGRFPRPLEVNSNTPPALEAVVLKAMAKDQEDRYQSAADLADDVKLWLDNEPVAVGGYQDPRSVRCSRWVRKHKTLVSSSVAALIVLAAALGVVLILVAGKNADLAQARRKAEDNAREAKDNARKSEENARDAAAERKVLHQKNIELDHERNKSDDNAKQATIERDHARLARRTISQILDDVTDGTVEALLTQQQTLSPELTAFLKRILQRYEVFERQYGKDDSLKSEVARAQFYMSRIADRLGDRPEAERCLVACVAQFETLSVQHPAGTEHRHYLLRAQGSLANLYGTTGKPDKSRELHAKAVALAQALATELPDRLDVKRDSASVRVNYANWLLNNEKYDLAEAEYRLAIEALKKLPESADISAKVATARTNRAAALRLLGRTGEALTEHQASIEAWRELVKIDPLAANWDGLASALQNLAALANSQKQVDLAVTSSREVVSIRRNIAAALPQVPEHQAKLANGLNALGASLTARGISLLRLDRRLEAEASFQEGESLWSRLVSKHPDVPEYQAGLARVSGNWASLWSQVGKHREAADKLNQALISLNLALAKEPNRPDFKERFRHNRFRAAEAHIALRDHAEAIRAIDSAVAVAFKPADDCYTAAVLSAQCVRLAETDKDLSPIQRGERQKTYADRVVPHLTKSTESGHQNMASLLGNQVFDVVRGRADFQLLSSRLGEKKPK